MSAFLTIWKNTEYIKEKKSSYKSDSGIFFKKLIISL